MKTRAITGLLFIAVLIVAVLLGPYTFVLLFYLFAACAVYEFYRMVQSENNKPFLYLATGVATVGLGLTSLVLLYLLPDTILNFGIICIVQCYIMPLIRKTTSPIQDLAYSLFSHLYAVIPFIICMSLGFFRDTYNAFIPLGLLILL